MIRFLRTLYPILDRRTRKLMIFTAVAMLGLALLEVLALIMLMPVMQYLTAPNNDPASPLFDLASNWMHADRSKIVVTLACIAGVLYVCKGIASIAVARWNASFALKEEASLAKQLIGLYLSSPYSLHLRRNSAEFQRTINSSLRQILGPAFIGTLSSLGGVASVALIAVVLLTTDPGLSVALGIYLAFVGYFYKKVLHRQSRKAGRTIHAHQATDFRYVNQSLMAVKEIKLRNGEDFFASQIYSNRMGSFSAYRTISLLGTIPRYVLEIALVGAACVIGTYTFSVQSTSEAAATSALFLAGGLRILAPLNKLLADYSLTQSAMPALESIRNDFSKIRPEPRVDSDDVLLLTDRAPSVSCENVTFSYENGVRVLDGVSLTVKSGQRIALVGGSGAGKSTMVDLILGVLSADGGSILIDGTPIDQVKRSWQSMIGYVPQTISLFDDTVRRNVALAVQDDEIDDNKVWSVLEMAQLGDVVRNMSDGLDSGIGESGLRLSGGQRQRLGLARALYHDPKVIVLDEATSALDAQTERNVTDVIDSLKGSITTIVVAHRLSTVRRVDTIYYMEHGKVVAFGTFEELQSEIPNFARLVALSDLTTSDGVTN